MTDTHPTSPRGAPPARSWGRRLAASAAGLLLLAGAAIAQSKPEPAVTKAHLENGTVTSTSNIPGDTANYEFTFRHGGGNADATNPQIRVTFPAGYDLSGASWNQAGSGLDLTDPPTAGTWPNATTPTVDSGSRFLNLAITDGFLSLNGQTTYRVAITGVINAPTGGNQSIQIQILQSDGVSVSTSGAVNFSLAGPPGTPAAPSITGRASGSLSIAWMAPSNGGSAITGYTVERSLESPISWEAAGGGCAAPGTGTSCTDATLTPGSRYVFRVLATNVVGDSPFSSASASEIAATEPSQPAPPSAVAGDTQATVSWVAPSDGGSPITEYFVSSDPAVGSPWACTTPGNTTTCVVTGLTNGVSYTFRVAAQNVPGNGPTSDSSAPITPFGTASAPQNVSASAGNASADVSWLAPASDGGSAVTSYTVSSTPASAGCTATAPALTCNVGGLTNGTSYTFTVTATNAGGEGPASAPSAAVTPQRDTSTTTITGTTASLNTGTRARTNEAFTVNFTVSSTDAAGISEGGTVTVEAQTSLGAVIGSCSGAAVAGSGSCVLSGLKPSDNVARLVASFAQTPRLLASQSGPFAFDVTRSNTTSTLTSNSPTVFGQDIVLSATFNATAPGANPVTGTARFVRQPGNITITEVAITPGIGGAASTASTTITTDPAVAGSPYTYNVAILDNTDFIGSNASTVHTVNRANTTVTINSISPAVGPDIEVNETVTVSATVAAVAPGEGTPTGIVQVRGTGGDAAATSGCDISLSGGTGTCQLSFSTKGGATLVFSYVESANFAASSNSQAVTVLGLPVTMTLAPPVGPLYFGNTYEVGYSLTGGAGNFEGAVTLSATGPTNASATCASTSAPLNNTGVCTFTGGQSVGAYTLSGAYAGDTQDLAANDDDSLSIVQATTDLSVSTLPTSSAAGENVTLSVNLSLTNGSGLLDGTIEVTANGLTNAGAPSSGCTIPVSGQASPFTANCTRAFTLFGNGQVVSAVFNPSSTNFAGDSATTLHDVTSALTTTTIDDFSPTNPQVGDAVTVNFDVNGGEGTYEGTIEVSVNGTGVTCDPVVSFNTTTGVGSCRVPALFQAAADYSFVVDFVGAMGGNDASSTSAPSVVTVAPRSTTLSLSAAPAAQQQAGQNVVFTLSTAAITDAFLDGFNAGNVASGTAYVCLSSSPVCDSASALCTATLSGAGTDGAASGTCPSSFAAVGNYSFVANYVGNTNFAGSTSVALPYAVEPRDTSISITRVSSFTSGSSPATSALVGERVTVAFDVDGGLGEYEGSVTVSADGPGALAATCSGGSFDIETGVGSCTFSVGSLNGLEQVGTWSFSADFIPGVEGNDAASTTGLAAASISITQASTTLVLSSSPVPSVFGQPFTLTATVTAQAPAEGYPTGDVNFFDGESNAIGVVTLSPTATAGVSTASISNLIRDVAPPPGWRFVAATITNPNFAGANDFGYDHLVNRDDQTVAVTAPGSLPFAVGGSFNVSAVATANFTTGPSGQAVNLSAGPAGVCSGSGSSSGNPGSNVSISIIGGGTCVITASVPQSQNYNAVAPQTVNVEITPIDQTITFAALPNRSAAAGTFELVATSDSGLTVSFDSTTPAVCTVSGTTVSYVGAGTCSITASQGGNASYNPAVPVTQGFIYVAVTVAPATLPDGTRGTAYSETVSASGLGAEAPFVYSLSSGTLPIGITLTGDTLSGTPTTPGNSTFTIRATATNSGPGNVGSPYFGEQTYTVNIAKQAQTITFGALPDRLLSASPFTVAATADSNLPVSFASGTAGVCTVAGDQVTLVAAGTCSITASQAGDANYAAADSVIRSFEVRDAVVITTASPLTNGVHDVAYGPLQFAATGGNGSYVFSLSAGALPTGMSLSASGELSGTPSGAGTFNFDITATDTSPALGPFSGTKSFVLVIERAPLALTFIAPTPASVVYSVGGSFNVATSGNNENPVSFSAGPAGVCAVDGTVNTQINLIGAGTCTVTASATQSANIQAGSFNAPVGVDQATPSASLVVSPLTSSPNGSVTLTATVSGSGGPTGTVSFRNGGTDIVGCVNVALVAGEAQCVTTTLPEGTNLLTARYNGDTSNIAVVSNEVSQVVLTGTTIVLSPGNLSEARFGQTVNVGYTVSGGVAPNAGNVTVTATRPGSTVICTAPASAGTCALPPLVTTGPVLADGYTITAAYEGDANDGASTTAVSQTLNVLRANTNTALSIAPANSSPFGQGFTLTATVTSVAPGGGVPPGTIVFLRDGESIGEIALVNGVATLNVAAGLPVGNYVFRAEYAQTTNYLQSFENRNYAITAKATTTTITGASANPSALTAAVQFSYTVVANVAGTTPTGNVTLTASTGETSTCTVAAGQCGLTFNTAGARTVTAAYAGDSQHAASTSAAFSQTVNQGSTTATLSITPASPAQIGQSVSFDVTVTGTPGSPLPTGTVSVVHGAAPGTPICGYTLPGSGCQVSFTSEQNFSNVRAVYAGDSNFTGATSNTVASYVVQKVPTSIVFTTADSTITFGQSIAIATSVSGGINGNLGLVTVTATAAGKTPVTCSAVATAGSCSLMGLEAATWTLAATYAGDADDQASSTAMGITVTVNKATQTITFGTNPGPFTFGGTAGSVSATASSGLTVSYSTGSTTVCSVDAVSGAITIIGAGDCVVAANQAGNDNYEAAPEVTQTVVINKAEQTITFGTNPGPFTFGGTAGSVSATASSGLTVSYSTGSTTVCSVDAVSGAITIIGAGDCVVAANQAGNDNYLAAPEVTQTVVINKAAQTITFGTNPGPFTFGGTAGSVSATASSGLTVSYSTGSTTVCSVDAVTGAITIIGAGNCVVAANQPGNDNYLAAPEVTQTVVINKAAQTITFGANPGPFTFGGASGSVSATASSGLTVSYSTASPACSVDPVSGAITIIGAGNCVVAANQAGNSNYEAAPEVTQTVVINPANQAALVVTATPNPVIAGQTSALATTGGSGSGAVTYAVTTGGANCSVTGSTLTALAAGTCTVTATKAADANYLVQTGSVVVTVNPATVDLSIVKTGRYTLTGITWELLVSNAGPGAANGASVIDALPNTVENASWTCVTNSGGGTCATASGTGDVDVDVNLPANSSVVITITANVIGTPAAISNTAEVIAPDGITDTNPANNTFTLNLTVALFADGFEGNGLQVNAGLKSSGGVVEIDGAALEAVVDSYKSVNAARYVLGERQLQLQVREVNGLLQVRLLQSDAKQSLSSTRWIEVWPGDAVRIDYASVNGELQTRLAVGAK